jgi:hypothetical protein
MPFRCSFGAAVSLNVRDVNQKNQGLRPEVRRDLYKFGTRAYTLPLSQCQLLAARNTCDILLS